MPFSEKTAGFLFENRLHNQKEWFQAHQEEYQQFVLKPFQELVVSLTPTMLSIDPFFTTAPQVTKTISRIYRDTRYSKDKSLYRDNMWIIFKRGKMHGTEVPGFYFELGSSGFSYGCGFYHSSPAYMEQLRRLVLAEGPSARAALEAYRSQHVFQIEGDRYKRPKCPHSSPFLQDWLERKTICFTAESQDSGLLFSEKLAEKLAEDFLLLKPIYQFMLDISALLS